MITRIELKNFKSIGSQTIDLDKLTVLVGRNGAGKTTIVDALKFVRDALVGSLDDAVLARHGMAAMRRWSPTRPYDVEIVLTIESARLFGRYGFVLASGKDGGFKVKSEFGEVATAPGEESEVFERSSESWKRIPDVLLGSRFVTASPDPLTLALPVIAIVSNGFSRLRNFLRSMCFYSIFPNTLREPQKPSALRVLDDHGANLASIARSIKNENRRREMISALDSVVGGVVDMRVEQVGGFLVTQLLRKVSDNREAWFDLSQESDGTLRMLGLLVALYQPAPSSFVAVEEPELTLHPGALGVLSDILHETSVKRQLMITTQSPDLIARFSAKSLRVVERVDGITHVGPVSEMQRNAIEQQLFTSGDLLRLEGLHR